MKAPKQRYTLKNNDDNDNINSERDTIYTEEDLNDKNKIENKSIIDKKAESKNIESLNLNKSK
jgi:hypothetical protein